MKRFVTNTLFLMSFSVLSGCFDIMNAGASGGQFEPLAFTVISEGTQSDGYLEQYSVSTDQESFNTVLATVPSISGAAPTTDFTKNDVLTVLTGIGICNDLEVTDVIEYERTLVFYLTEVVPADSGWCDPSPEGFNSFHYAMIAVPKIGKNVSVQWRYQETF